MAYRSKNGRRPDEYASKTAHSHIINDSEVKAFLQTCNLPKKNSDIDLTGQAPLKIENPAAVNPIRYVIAVDGGYTEVPVKVEFPSATLCFFQFGALFFRIDDLENLEQQAFINPDDMSKLKNIQRLKLVLPTRNISLKTESTLTHSVRRAIYDFFCRKMEDDRLIDSLQWFIFQEYGGMNRTEYRLAQCPTCASANIPLTRAKMSATHTFACDECGGEIYLTDVFRLHEAIDDELGAGGIMGYVTTTLEQLILVHLIRLILKTKPSLLGELLFIKDGPLAYFGQTANMHKPMRVLVSFLLDKHNLYMAGLEKSGAFVEHADEIAQRLDPGTVLLLNNEYIYRNILPGKADPANPYGRTTYYSNKLVFKTENRQMYVISIPTVEVLYKPEKSDFRNLQAILSNVQKLRCDMYDNSLIPVALANKLVSLSNHPSSKILKNFATGALGA